MEEEGENPCPSVPSAHDEQGKKITRNKIKASGLPAADVSNECTKRQGTGN